MTLDLLAGAARQAAATTDAEHRPWPLPEGPWSNAQSWLDLAFLHWRVDKDALAKLVGRSVEIDLFDGEAWLGIVPFVLADLRLRGVPPLPRVSTFPELNVRTYVTRDDKPGVWFFSLDAESRLAVWGARTFYHLPYFGAQMSLAQEGMAIHYRSHRTHPDAPPADFEASWKIGAKLSQSEPGSLEFFLTERYCLYAAHRDRLYRCRIHHPSWPLQQASVSQLHSTMIEAHGLKTPAVAPLLHYAEALKVDIWPLRRIG